MDAPSEKVARRRRKPQPRRIPSVVEQRDRKPLAFGWGADLTHRERESVKERIALFAGIILALVIAGLIGYGLLYDNVIRPNQIAANNAKPVAKVGSYEITVGFFKTYEQFRYSQLQSNLQQDQSVLPQYQANPKKNASIISQLNSEISSLQQEETSLPQDTLTLLINSHTILQRAAKAGVKDTPAQVAKVMKKLQDQIGGPLHFKAFLASSGLTYDQIRDLEVADDLQKKLNTKLAAGVKQTQLETRASHILIKDKQKALAEQVLRKAVAGANFAALAKKYSIDTASAKVGGDLGFFSKDKMVAPFANAAFSGAIGKVIPHLVHSQFGWHIIKVTARKQMKLSATDLAQAKQQAFSTWLQKQKSILGVQQFISAPNLPTIATTPTAQTILQATSPPISTPVPVRTVAPKAKKK